MKATRTLHSFLLHPLYTLLRVIPLTTLRASERLRPERSVFFWGGGGGGCGGGTNAGQGVR
jgi:hypothetical protein